MKKCISCGKELNDDAMFCRYCGAKQEKEKRFCDSCGAEIADDATFCEKCGFKFVDIKEEKNPFDIKYAEKADDLDNFDTKSPFSFLVEEKKKSSKNNTNVKKVKGNSSNKKSKELQNKIDELYEIASSDLLSLDMQKIVDLEYEDGFDCNNSDKEKFLYWCERFQTDYIEELEECLKTNDDFYKYFYLYYYATDGYITKKEITKCEKILYEIVDKYPYSFTLCLTIYRKESYDDSMESLIKEKFFKDNIIEKALALKDSNLSAALYYGAYLYHMNKNKDESLKYLNKVINCNIETNKKLAKKYIERWSQRGETL